MEFFALRCCACATFNVQASTKNCKWACRMCGRKQSIVSVFARSGSAAVVRVAVQRLSCAAATACPTVSAAVAARDHSVPSAPPHTVRAAHNGHNGDGAAMTGSVWMPFMKDDALSSRPGGADGNSADPGLTSMAPVEMHRRAAIIAARSRRGSSAHIGGDEHRRSLASLDSGASHARADRRAQAATPLSRASLSIDCSSGGVVAPTVAACGVKRRRNECGANAGDGIAHAGASLDRDAALLRTDGVGAQASKPQALLECAKNTQQRSTVWDSFL